MTMATRATRTVSQATDVANLKHIGVEWIGEAEPTWSDSDTYRALQGAGVITASDLLSLTEQDLQGLIVPGTAANDPSYPLALIKKRKLIIALALYHESSRAAGKPLCITGATRANFDHYRTSQYDPSRKITPWMTVIEDENLSTWRKNVKPSSRDFKEHRDDAYWQRNKERFEVTIKSQGLQHLIEEGYVAANPDLDRMQQDWLYKVFQDTMLTPAAKTIVTKHNKDQNTREIWKELCEYYETSVDSTIRANKISTWLTSARLHNVNWKGTQSNFILHWQEQSRIYNEISDEPYTEKQLINFLQLCVSGTESLKDVHQIHLTACQSVGAKSMLCFSEYVERLVAQAIINDNGSTLDRNPRARRSANAHRTPPGRRRRAAPRRRRSGPPRGPCRR